MPRSLFALVLLLVPAACFAQEQPELPSPPPPPLPSAVAGAEQTDAPLTDPGVTSLSKRLRADQSAAAADAYAAATERFAAATVLVGYPVTNPSVACVFASVCASQSSQHTGMDFTSSDRNVYAAAPGKVVLKQVNGVGCTCNGPGCGCQDHGLGNAVVLQHTRSDDGSTFYTLYAHNASFAPNLSVGQNVAKGTVIATMGGSGYGLSNYWGVHSHFEVKSAATLANPSGSGTYYGYTPSSPLNYGYFNPANYINIVGVQDTQPVQVTDFWQKNTDGRYTITCLTNNLVDAQFKLVNTSGNSIFFSTVAMAIHRESDDAFVADVALQYNVSIAANGTYQFPRSFLDGTNPNLQAGTYRLVAKVYYSGAWLELTPYLPFIIVSRSNTCGGDPDVTSLANQTVPAKWYFFTGASGRWYIANTSANVLALKSTPGFPAGGSLPWKPISNYGAYAGYPAAGLNYSYVQVSADGKNVSFGSLQGGGSDPEVAQLANQTVPVKWIYFQDPRTIWYIFESYGGTQAVMRLMGYDPALDVLWKPIHNYPASSGYPAAGYVYQYVYASNDGRSLIFGPLK